MISYAYENLFKQNSVDKQYIIRIYEGETYKGNITNVNLYSQDLEVTSSLCSEESLIYGTCEAGYIKFKVNAYVGTLKNKRLVLSVTPKTAQTALQIGEYYVQTDKISDDRKSRDIIAYDALYTIINANMDEWYSELNFPMTLADFRDEFFDYFDITQETATLPNDSLVITQTILPDKLSGKTVLNAICSANGCFGKINNLGHFEYVFLDNPDEVTYDNYYQGSLIYEDYTVQQITKLKVFSNNDVEVTIGSGSNQYVIEDNFLFYDKFAADLTPYIQNLYDVISQTPVYRPLRFQSYGDYCIETGDYVTITTPNGTEFSTLVLEKTTRGIQGLVDKIEAEGTEVYTFDLNSTNSEIRRLWNNTLALQNEIENSRTYVYAHRNTANISLDSTTARTIITIPIATVDDTIPVFLATIPLTMSADGTVTFRYFLDGVEINDQDTDTIYLTKGEQFVTLSNSFEMAGNQNKRFTVTAQTGYRQSVDREQTAKILSLKDWIDNQSISVSGNVGTFNYSYVEQPIDTTPPGATINAFDIRAMIFASGLSPEQPWDGTLVLVDEASTFDIVETSIIEAVEFVDISHHSPTGDTLSDNASFWNTVNVTFEDNVSEAVIAVCHADMFELLTEEDEILVTENDEVFYTEGD